MIYECPSCGRQARRKPTRAELLWGGGHDTVYGLCPDCELDEAEATIDLDAAADRLEVWCGRETT